MLGCMLGCACVCVSKRNEKQARKHAHEREEEEKSVWVCVLEREREGRGSSEQREGGEHKTRALISRDSSRKMLFDVNWYAFRFPNQNRPLGDYTCHHKFPSQTEFPTMQLVVVLIQNQ